MTDQTIRDLVNSYADDRFSGRYVPVGDKNVGTWTSTEDYRKYCRELPIRTYPWDKPGAVPPQRPAGKPLPRPTEYIESNVRT